MKGITKGGLILPDIAKSKSRTGTVLKLGDGIQRKGKLCPFECEVGDVVWFNMLGGIEIPEMEDDLIVIPEREIIMAYTPILMTLYPLDNRVLLELVEEPKKTEGGILLPEIAQKQSNPDIETYRVIEKGRGTMNDDGGLTEISLNIFDTVHVRRYSGSDISNDSLESIHNFYSFDPTKTYRVIRESDILAIQES